MAKMWAGRTSGVVSSIADDFNSSIRFDCKMYKQDITGSMAHAAMLAAIESRFPGVVEEGMLNRKKLGAIVFADEKALLDLNRITHAAVKQEVLRRLDNAPGGVPIAIDAIALFEGGLAELCDVTVAVCAPVEDRVKRIILRDGISEEYARNRIDAQHPDDWFRSKCDYTLENDGKLDAFATKCVAFLRNICIMRT